MVQVSVVVDEECGGVEERLVLKENSNFEGTILKKSGNVRIFLFLFGRVISELMYKKHRWWILASCKPVIVYS